MSDLASETRTPCVVFGCRRTFRRDADDDGDCEYICGDHYRLADRRLRRFRTRIKRAARKLGWTPRLIDMDMRAWRRAVQQATERALGL